MGKFTFSYLISSLLLWEKKFPAWDKTYTGLNVNFKAWRGGKYPHADFMLSLQFPLANYKVGGLWSSRGDHAPSYRSRKRHLPSGRRATACRGPRLLSASPATTRGFSERAWASLSYIILSVDWNCETVSKGSYLLHPTLCQIQRG